MKKKNNPAMSASSPSVHSRRDMKASVATTGGLSPQRSSLCPERAGAFQAKRGESNSSLFHLPSSLDIISDYVTEGLLALDPAKPLAVIDWRLHLMYADDEAKLARWPWPWLIRMGLIERDVRYRRLLKMVVLYIELMRGRLQSDYEARLILAGTPRDEAHAKALERYGIHTGPLHFIVTGPDAKPLLLGTYDHDKIALASPPALPQREGAADIADDENDDENS